MSDPPRTIHVPSLPATVFGIRNLPGWATIGFMVIEGTTIAILLVSYVYVRRNFVEWPPAPTPLPDLSIPTANMLLLLLVIVPMALVGRASHKLELPRVRLWLATATALSAGTIVLRFLELDALNVRWDSHAYGSVVWMLVGFHATLLLIDFIETAVLTALAFSKQMEQKHYTDFEDASFYQYFLSLTYVPIYIVVFWVPRWT